MIADALPILSTDQLLQKAILLHPHDDAPRLQYADWLEERDGDVTCLKCDDGWIKSFWRTAEMDSDERCNSMSRCPTCDGQGVASNNYGMRAEFIRLQMRDCKLDSYETEKRRIGIGHDHQRVWFSLPFASRFSCVSSHATGSDIGTSCRAARRGFIDEIHCTLAEFMKHGQAIARQHPVTKWVLTDVSPHFTNSNYQWWRQLIGSELRQVNGYLPSIFFEGLLVGSTVTPDQYRSSVLVYRTETEAIADIHQACYHYARQGLDDYVPPPTPAIL